MMLRKAIYPKIEVYLNSIAKIISDKGFTPIHLSLAGLVLNFLCGWIYASGWIWLAGLFMIFAGLGDMLDGPVARVSGKTSNFGAFIDSTLDRYSDFFIFGGLAIHYANEQQVGWFLLVMGIILGAYVTSYTKARAENFIKHCNIGLFERTERILTLALGSLIPSLLPLMIWVLFIGTNATAIHRIVYTRKILEHGAN